VRFFMPGRESDRQPVAFVSEFRIDLVSDHYQIMFPDELRQSLQRPS